MEKRSFLATDLFCLLLGWLGVHRFYTGYIGIGILQLLTLGCLGIWTTIDFIMINIGQYKDSKGNELEGFNQNTGYIFLGVAILIAIIGATHR